MFYKYHRLNSHLYELLMNNEFYFAFAKDLNDPMDCKFNIINEGDEEDWKKWLDRFNFFPPEVKDSLLKYIKTLNYDEKKLFKNDNRFDLLKSYFVLCCFCEINDSVKMWSHYTDSHKGVCLSFEPEKIGESIGFQFENLVFNYENDQIPRNFYPLTKVDYQDEIPEPYNNLKEPPSNLFKFLKTKHTRWSEEKEHRLIVDYHIVKAQKFKFEKKHLKEIIFGLNIDESSKKLIIDLVTELYINKGFPVNYYQAEEPKSAYNLIINKI